MTNAEFRTKLAETFKTHMFMKDREQHTVNELLYVLEHNSIFSKESFTVTIKTLKDEWWSIPCPGAFVTVALRGCWFNDAEVEFEIDECGDEKFNCITVYECEREENK